MTNPTNAGKAAEETTPEETQESGTISQAAPLVIDLGKKKRKTARKIKKGRGPVLDHIDQAVQYTVESLGDHEGDAIIVPVVLIYERKRKRRRYYSHDY